MRNLSNFNSDNPFPKIYPLNDPRLSKLFNGIDYVRAGQNQPDLKATCLPLSNLGKLEYEKEA
jgi:hypothetical protein